MKAAIKTTIPNRDYFVIRGTVPIPKGYTYGRNVSSPFTLVSPDGTKLATQWDRVSRYPNGDPAVVKLSAVASRGTMLPESIQEFSIIEEDSQMYLGKASQDIMDLFLNDNNIRLRVTDVHDNIYEESISITPGNNKHRTFRLHESGPAIVHAEIAGALLPQEISSTSLSHFGGLQAFAIGYSDNVQVLPLALDWHNGVSEDPAANLYFKKLELIIPLGWSVVSEWPEPTMGNVREENDELVLDLVGEDVSGNMHLLPQFFHRLWRLCIFKNGHTTDANDIINQLGWGTCVTRDDLWSWHNPKTANYYPQRMQLPTLDHITNDKLTEQKDQLYNELAQGLPWYNSQGFGRMGMWNPAGTPYGGMTGGNEVHQYDGVRASMLSNPDGLLYHRVKHRRYSDRQQTALYKFDGKPINMDQYLNSNNTAPWRMFNNKFQNMNWPNQHLKDDAPWEFDAADQSHVSYVAVNNLQPDYEDNLLSYDPIDHQHEIRRVKDLKALIWLDNDPIARRHLAAQAEIDRMVYYEGPKGRLNGILNTALNNPNLGGSFGRGHAWASDSIITHYAISNDIERQRLIPWLNTLRSVLLTLQMDNGLWQREFTSKMVTGPPLNGGFSALRPNESMFAIHMLQGLLSSVFDNDSALFDAQWLACIGMWTFCWKWKVDGSGPDGRGPWSHLALGSLDPNVLPFKDHSEHPPKQYLVSEDSYHFAASLAVALKQAQYRDPAFVTFVHKTIRQHLNSNDPLNYLQSQTLKQLDSRAPLLALLQP